MTTNANEYIKSIAPTITNVNHARGNPIFNSVIIAQACHETGFGKSSIMTKANAPFGIKAGQSWKGKVYSARTQEFYDKNNPVTITDSFRAYDTLEQAVNDYLDLITKSQRYRKATCTSTPKECITAIINGGYATDPNYINEIMFIITHYNLTKYDTEQIESLYKIGQNYITQVNLNVRAGAGTYYRQIGYNELTQNAKIHAFKHNLATLKKGTIVTVLDMQKNGQDIWLKIPSGWIAGFYGGKWYVK